MDGLVLCLLMARPDAVRRMGPKKMLDAVDDGTKGIPLVGVAGASAGMVLGAVALTGIGGKLVGFVIAFAGNTPFLALLLIMLVSLVLGMGLPTTGAYILASALGAPVLIKLGFAPLAAHMFVFYYAIISNITPPVALAAYAASSIAQSPPNRTGFQAMKLSCLGFLVPFAFFYDPGLLMLGGTQANMLAVFSGLIGVFAFGAFWVGYGYGPLGMVSRVLLAVGGIIAFAPQPLLVTTGCLCVMAVWAYSWYQSRSHHTQQA